jgi:hypothetical protein
MTFAADTPARGTTGTRTMGGTKTRILFLLAGTVTLIGVLLSATVSSWFLLIPTLVAANQLLMAATGRCTMSLLLDRTGIGTDRPTRTRLPSRT